MSLMTLNGMVTFSVNSWLAILLVMLSAYLLGSMNWAIILTRLFTGKDIRKVGSGNAGATNVLRSQGVVPAVLTLVGDIGKGVLAAFLGGFIMSSVQLNPSDVPIPMLTHASLVLLGRYLAGVFVVLGHLYPVFHGFRGGKGVAAAAGLIFVLDWRMALMCMGLFVLTVAVSRMVSLGSVLAVSYVPVLTFVLRRWADDMPMETAIFCTVLTAIVALCVIFKHGSNMRRIADGTERRIGEQVSMNEPTEQAEEK